MQISIKNLRVQAIIGVHPRERTSPQEIRLTITLEYDAAGAIASDRIDDALDYDKLSRNVVERIQSARFFLIERLASEILQLILSDPRVRFARVEVDKPNALSDAESVSAAVEKRR